MYRFIILFTLIIPATFSARKVPKIYNALITSDQNLSPSQAFPILEPVVKTTAVGVAFPPIVVQQSGPENNHLLPSNLQQEKEISTAESPSLQNVKMQMPHFAQHGSLYPLAYEPYYEYHRQYLYPPLPYYQQYQHPVYVDVAQYENSKKSEGTLLQSSPSQAFLAPVISQLQPQLQQPIQLQNKNPEISDVLPPLPIKSNERLEKQM